MAAAGIVKFGSTSTTMLVAQHLDQPLLREQRLINLFGPEGPEQALVWAGELKRRAAALGATPLAAGGEAVRANPDLERALQEVFPRWWHLTPESEGRLAWAAVKARHPSCDIVLDIGGGSTEIVALDQTWSLPVGAARSPEVVTWPELSRYERPVFIGGSAVSVSMWTGRGRCSPGDVENLRQSLLINPEQFTSWDTLRRAILPQGLALMASLVERGRWPTFEISGRGLTEGLWLAASLGRGGSR